MARAILRTTLMLSLLIIAYQKQESRHTGKQRDASNALDAGGKNGTNSNICENLLRKAKYTSKDPSVEVEMDCIPYYTWRWDPGWRVLFCALPR